MEIGDTFLLKSVQIDDHLWVVISEPQQDADHVIIVSLTTLRAWKDRSCILQAGEHPWIRHETCVSFQDAKSVSESQLDLLVRAGTLVPQPQASDELLRKIVAGANATEEMPIKCRRVLVEQGLVDN